MNDRPTTMTIPPEAPGALWRWSVRLLAMIALLVCLALLWTSLDNLSILPGCGLDGGSGCAMLIKDPKWSKWLGIPVSGLAALAYVVVFIATLNLGRFHTKRQRRNAWTALLTLAFMLVSAAVWFTGVQIKLKTFCPYCMTTHALGVVTSILILARFPYRQTSNRSAALACGLGAVGVVILIAGQLLYEPRVWTVHQVTTTQIPPAFPPPIRPVPGSPGQAPDELPEPVHGQTSRPADFDTGPGPERQLSIVGRQFLLRPHDMPTRGSADARYILVDLFDYSCPACRQVHGFVHELLEHFGDQLGVVIMPVPLNQQCNPLMKSNIRGHENACDQARHAIAVWRADPSKFAEMDDWLFADPWPKKPEDIRAHAVELVGEAELDKALADPWVTQYIASAIRTWDTVEFEGKRRTVPMLVAYDMAVQGLPASAKPLIDILDKYVIGKQVPNQAPADMPAAGEGPIIPLQSPSKTKDAEPAHDDGD